MQIRTVNNHPKRPGQPGDDVVVVTDDCVAVIDGATDKSGHLYQWQGETVTSGRFAALVVAQSLTHTEPMTTPTLLVQQATTALREAVTRQYPDLPTHENPSCAVVAYQPSTRTLWRVGDCQWTYQGTTHALRKEIDVVTAGIRAAVTETLIAAGVALSELAATDPGRVAIHDLLSRQSVFANQRGHFGYGCLNGTPVPDCFLETHTLDTGHRLTLTSDGYPEILDTFEATEARLADLLAQDPLCIHDLQGTKALAPGNDSFDDRTWVDLTT